MVGAYIPLMLSAPSSMLEHISVLVNPLLPIPTNPALLTTQPGVYQTPAQDCEDVTDHAIKAGYRHVDSATVYKNEQPAAAGMLKSGIPRDQLFFTSKVSPRSINYKDAKAGIDESLKKTGLDYIDLYLLHAPYGGKEGRLGAWRALVEAAKDGKIRSYGVSNYGVHHLEELEEWQKVSITSTFTAAGLRKY